MPRWTGCMLVVVLATLGLTASATAADLERYVHTLVNQYRTGQGLPSLTFRLDIAAIARQHSRDMAIGRVGVSHSGWDGRGDQVVQLLPAQGAAENVAFSSISGKVAGERVVDGWIHSPGHRRNMEGAYNLTGVGIVQGPHETSFYTQIFVKTPAYRSETVEKETVRAVPREETRRPARRPRYEKDPRQRPGRRRTAWGWKQQLD